MFPGTIFEKFYRKLARQSGVPDLSFGKAERLDNSGLALKAAEFAKGTDSFDHFHDSLFRAHFVEEKNISRLETILDVAVASGLEAQALETALQKHKFTEIITRYKEMACREGISGVPTFIVNDRHRLVGAQPLDGFRNYLKQLNK